MTYRYSIFLILATISGDTAPLGAHVGDRLYPISYLSEETLAALDLDNANVEDWVEAVGEPTLTLLDFDLRPSYTQVTSYGPSNLDFRIWLGWSRDGKSISPASLPTMRTTTNMTPPTCPSVFMTAFL